MDFDDKDTNWLIHFISLQSYFALMKAGDEGECVDDTKYIMAMRYNGNEETDIDHLQGATVLLSI